MKIEKSKCVYVFENKAAGIVKIGVSDNVNNRLICIECSAGMKIDFIFSTLPIYNYIEIEKKLHEKFKCCRGIGEWFNITPDEVVNYIQKIKYMFIVDSVVKHWVIDSNISLLSKKFNVSRAAISKHLSKYDQIKNGGIKADDINNVEVLEITPEKLKDIPANCNKIKSCIYEKENVYYVKKFAKTQWFIEVFNSVDECDIYIKSLEID
jgi:hypothetical protein